MTRARSGHLDYRSPSPRVPGWPLVSRVQTRPCFRLRIRLAIALSVCGLYTALKSEDRLQRLSFYGSAQEFGQRLE
jgi:hypothetical protein